MRIELMHRNSPSPRKNELFQFEKFSSILCSLYDSTNISVKISDSLQLSNSKYCLTIGIGEVEEDVLNEVINTIVLRRKSLSPLLELKLFNYLKSGSIEVSRQQDIIRNRVIVLNEQAS